jgi:hypothetical protein
MPTWIGLLVPSESGDRSRRAPLSPELAGLLMRAAKAVRAPASRTGIEPRFSVYVVLLDFAYGGAEWGLYVGMTGLTPRERYLHHKAGIKSSGSVRKYGIGLLPRLYTRLNPLDWEPAKEVEPALAEALRIAGIPVVQN